MNMNRKDSVDETVGYLVVAGQCCRESLVIQSRHKLYYQSSQYQKMGGDETETNFVLSRSAHNRLW